MRFIPHSSYSKTRLRPPCNPFLHRSSRTKTVSSLSSILRLAMELQRQDITSPCLNCMPARSTGRQPSALWPMKGSHCFADASSLTNSKFLSFIDQNWQSVAQGSQVKTVWEWHYVVQVRDRLNVYCSENDAASIGPEYGKNEPIDTVFLIMYQLLCSFDFAY
jgi:hypothetical protein